MTGWRSSPVPTSPSTPSTATWSSVSWSGGRGGEVACRPLRRSHRVGGLVGAVLGDRDGDGTALGVGQVGGGRPDIEVPPPAGGVGSGELVERDGAHALNEGGPAGRISPSEDRLRRPQPATDPTERWLEIKLPAPLAALANRPPRPLPAQLSGLLGPIAGTRSPPRRPEGLSATISATTRLSVAGTSTRRGRPPTPRSPLSTSCAKGRSSLSMSTSGTSLWWSSTAAATR